MNVDEILRVMNQQGVRYLLIGGMNFMLRHRPLLTYDVDLWIEDSPENRAHCEQALKNLDAEWGSTDQDWAHVSKLPVGWLERQAVFCLNSPHGAIDIMRAVAGLDSWEASWRAGLEETTNAGTSYRGISDEDMLKCQLALEVQQQKKERVQILREILQRDDD